MAKIAESSNTDDWYLSFPHNATVYLSSYNKTQVNATGKINEILQVTIWGTKFVPQLDLTMPKRNSEIILHSIFNYVNTYKFCFIIDSLKSTNDFHRTIYLFV